jgi:ABC-type Fe3+-hydroxamate transport system substrate-binding protein
MSRILLLALTLLALVASACGGEDEPTAANESTPAATPAADLGAIKTYLLDHTQRLVTSVEALNADARSYHELAKSTDFDYARLLESRRAEVEAAVTKLQEGHIKANPDYEEMEGVVAGVPELADYDVIIDAGSDGSDPESAVPFSFKTEDGREFKQPGNLFALVETSAFGTEPKFVAEGVEPDLDGDGKVTFPEALPDAQFLLAATTEFVKYAKELDAAAKAWEPKLEDAFTAVVVMTPTMSEYFAAWKNSRFIAGSKADEKAFVATSRLSDIRDILGGIVLIYDNIKPSVEDADPEGAQQTATQLKDLHEFAGRLLTEEEGGKRFTAEEADTLGSDAQRRAEAIAGQVSQQAGRLNLKLES